MSSQLLPYLAPLYATALILLGLMALAFTQRTLTGVRWFAAFLGALVVWTVGYAAEIALPGRAEMLLTVQVQYLGIALAPAAWLGFAAEYAGLPWWSRRLEVAVLVVPVLTVLVAWTNGFHGLMWTEVATAADFPVLDITRGPWFWGHVAFSYLCLLLAAGLYARALLVRPPLFRAQATLLLFAGLAPWAGNVLYLTGVSGGMDLTVFGFAVSALLAAWAILRWRLLAIGPVARDTIVEEMSQPVAVLDPERRVVDLNRAMASLLGTDEALGRPAGEALGRHLPELLPDRPAQATVGGQGSERAWEARATPVRDHRNRLRGWTLVLSDVTRREAEARALEEARRTAEETARAQRAFLANMNHELRTPLAGILGMLRLLDEADLGPDERRWVEMALESAGNLEEMVERVLAFADLETGPVELRRDPFLLRPVAADVVEAFGERARERGTELVLEADASLPLRVVGDAAALERVLTALVGNAVKFTHHGRVVLRLGDAGTGPDGPAVRFEVEDTGVGIPEDRLDDVLRGFVQADSSSTRAHQGAGLGLSIARALVEGMGGQLEVESRVGHGSRFWFALSLPVPQDG